MLKLRKERTHGLVFFSVWCPFLSLVQVEFTWKPAPILDVPDPVHPSCSPKSHSRQTAPTTSCLKPPIPKNAKTNPNNSPPPTTPAFRVIPIPQPKPQARPCAGGWPGPRILGCGPLSVPSFGRTPIGRSPRLVDKAQRLVSDSFNKDVHPQK